MQPEIIIFIINKNYLRYSINVMIKWKVTFLLHDGFLERGDVLVSKL